MTDPSDLPALAALEPFGWIFTPGPLPGGSISAEEAVEAAGGTVRTRPTVESGSYTEKGRYRQERDGRRVTLYSEHPVWAVTSEPEGDQEALGEHLPAERYQRHTLIDARNGQRITQFLLVHDRLPLAVLELHAPLEVPDLTAEEAVAAAIAGEERVLTDLPKTAEYGSRWRLIPGFVQVTDVWRITFDTSSLPPPSLLARPELAWVVIVDDKAGHRWLSAAVEEASVESNDTDSAR